MQLRVAVALAVVLIGGVVAVASGDEPAPPLSGYSVTAWTDADGLPFGAVNAIVQDGDGYLWIGTNAGLLRFDGARFALKDAIAEGLPAVAPVTALNISGDGALWVGLAYGAGVYRIRNGKAERQDQSHHLSGSVTAIAEDRNGTSWVVANFVLYRQRDSSWEPVPEISGAQGIRVTNVSVRKGGELLAGTTDGLYQYATSTKRFLKTADGWVWAASEDRRGDLWITDTVSGFRRVGTPGHPRRGFERNGYRLLHDRYGDLWLATIGEGLWRVGAGTEHDPVIEKATLQAGLFSDSVQSLFEDREGNLWVGTTVGLHRLTRQKLEPIANIGLVTTAEATGNGDLWVGTNYGLVRFSLANGRWQPIRIDSPTVYVRALHRDHDGTLWVGANEGLMRLSGRRLTAVVLPSLLSGVPITCVTTNERGELWIGDGKRLFEWDGSNLRRFEPEQKAGVNIGFAHHDKAGRLWVAFWDGSVGVLEQNRQFHVFDKSAFGPDNTSVFAVLDDANGQDTWFATSTGVSRLRAGRVTSITAKIGLPAGGVWALAQDRQGAIWTSIDLGVVRFTPKAFDESVSTTSHRVRYELYEPSDGLAGAPIVRVQSGSLSDGKLWFVRGGALTVADPGTLDRWPAVSPGPIRIEGAMSQERRFAAGGHATLPAGIKRIEINYTTVALTHPNRIRFRYRLDGFDTEWVEAGTRRTASYTNLPPRDYVFKVEAETDDGTWQSAAVAWGFSIQPMFFQTWWFYATCVAAIVAIAWSAWRFRVRLDRQRYAVVLSERTRLSREIHDTLLQSMVGVTLQLEDLANNDRGVSSEARLKLLKMRKRVASYIRDARQSIRDLRSPVLETQDLSAALRDVVGRATSGTSVRFWFTTSGEARRCSARLENEILRIAQEAVTNTLQHARATRIDIHLRFDPESVTVEITDDGCGLRQQVGEDDKTHYGIVSMRERAESLGGVFKINGSAERGTTVTATLPDPDAARVA